MIANIETIRNMEKHLNIFIKSRTFNIYVEVLIV